MATDIRTAQHRLLHALGDLYRIERRSDHLTDRQKQDVAASIKALEAEYDALIGLDGSATYASVSAQLRNARGRLNRIRDEREQLANSLIRAGEILGSFTQLLRLF